MANRNSSSTGILLAIAVVIGLIVLITKQKGPSTQVLIKEQIDLVAVEKNGVINSPTMSKIRSDIQKLQDAGIVELSISAGTLPNPILGQTKININSEGKIVCSIVLDVSDAVKAGDRAEPLLGHELKHVWDTLYLYDKKDPFASALIFIQTVANQTKVLYHDREVESSAIGIENIIRQELKASKNPIFTNMPASREAADALYVQKSKIDPSLRK
jgi:hypothetical protein